MSPTTVSGSIRHRRREGAIMTAQDAARRLQQSHRAFSSSMKDMSNAIALGRYSELDATVGLHTKMI
eukprot:4522334-Pyramimonas_sp.AAC.1